MHFNWHRKSHGTGGARARSPFPLTVLSLCAMGLSGTISPGQAAAQQTATAAAPAPAPTEEAKAAARTAYAAGQDAFNRGDYQTALQYFQRADVTIPAVQARYWIALCLDQLGRINDALGALGALVKDPDFSKLDADKQKTATDRYQALGQLPGTLSLTISPAEAALSVDGEPKQGVSGVFKLELAPGVHKFRATAAGYSDLEWEVTVEAAQLLDQPIALVVAPLVVVPVAPPPAQAAAPPPAPPPAEPASKTPAYVTLAVAGAGAIVGTVFGIRALAAEDDFNANPTPANADDVERNALIADMAFGITLTLGITGIVLLTTDEPQTDTARVPRPGNLGTVGARRQSDTGRLDVTPYVSKTGGGAAARLSF